jgi:hypothetical protein
VRTSCMDSIGVVQRIRRTLLLLFAASLAFGSQAQTQAPVQEVTAGWLSSPKALEQMKACSTEVSQSQLQRWQRADHNLQFNFDDRGAKRYLLVGNDTWLCMGMSDAGYAVLPTTLLAKAVQFDTDAAQQEKAYATVQVDLAASGTAKLLVPSANDHRIAYYFALNPGVASQLSVRIIHLKAADIKDGDFPNTLGAMPRATTTRLVFTDETNRQAAATGRPVAAGATLIGLVGSQRPLSGPYLQPNGNDATASHTFGGTRWRSTTSPKTELTFEPSGVLIEKTANATNMGTWRIQDSSLLFEVGNRYHTSELRNPDGEGQLLLAAIRQPPRVIPGIAEPALKALLASATSDAMRTSLMTIAAPRTMEEIRTRGSYFRADDVRTKEAVEAAWRRTVDLWKAQLEAIKGQRLQDSDSQSDKTGRWTLCPSNMTRALGGFDVYLALEGGTSGEACRSFTGQRRIWQDILQNGCNGRCDRNAL